VQAVCLKARPKRVGARAAGSCLEVGGSGLRPEGGAVMSHKQIYYSDKYDDEEFEYRLVSARGP
jgi:hypothetical protein